MNKMGTAFVSEPNKGKTTHLLEIFMRAYNANKNILVIDSATEHKDKSLIEKIITYMNCNYKLITSCEKSQIEFPKSTKRSFPYMAVEDFQTNVFLCDVALYLENGYNFPAGVYRENERLWYKKLSMQIIEVLIQKVDVILMDEIELIPESESVIKKIYKNDVELYMTLHRLEGLCGLDGMFRIERKIK